MLDDIVVLVVICSLFGASFLNEYIKNKRQAERMNDLEQNIAMVLKIMMEKVEEIHELKDYLPQFTINQNPLQGLFDAIAGNMTSGIKGNAPRDDAGRFAQLSDENGTQE